MRPQAPEQALRALAGMLDGDAITRGDSRIGHLVQHIVQGLPGLRGKAGRVARQLGTEPGNLVLGGGHFAGGERSHLLGQGFPPPAAGATDARPDSAPWHAASL